MLCIEIVPSFEKKNSLVSVGICVMETDPYSISQRIHGSSYHKNCSFEKNKNSSSLIGITFFCYFLKFCLMIQNTMQSKIMPQAFPRLYFISKCVLVNAFFQCTSGEFQGAPSWITEQISVGKCAHRGTSARQTSFKIVTWTKQTWTKHHNTEETIID